MNQLKMLTLCCVLAFSVISRAEVQELNSGLLTELKLKCTGSLFGPYAQCYGKELGALCPYYKGGKLHWGSCKAADSSGDEIYCLCR